ncbi:hypothetical protein SAMN05421830_1153 [Desulfomicrobium norvegicum]|uniref:Uncharacterized protein n=1 Tax=Desulfomicrobium norvegicum (strain DSM 1741 / NCIMB 8310) TaxID=52561 RepID=A0A8G2C5G4_DESNO|nr:hypothetical protein SAMN05421830_1153 [Desulfomicrobium norvegicum]
MIKVTQKMHCVKKTPQSISNLASTRYDREDSALCPQYMLKLADLFAIYCLTLIHLLEIRELSTDKNY